MSYEQALEAAGAKVLAFEEFGSYQGDWWAKVELNGQIGFVNGNYGSCSGCDAFEGDFGYGEDRCKEHRYDDPGSKECSECAARRNSYEARLAAFGKDYVDGAMSLEDAIALASKNLGWDGDAKGMVEWLRANA